MNINTIYNENCLVTAARMPDGFIDLTVTSPPYDDMRSYKNKIDQTWGERVWKPIIDELFRITKEGGVVVWIVGDRKKFGSESGTSFAQALYFKAVGFNIHDTMIFRKLNGAMGAHNEYLQEFEFMFVFSKGKIKTSNLIYDRKNVVHGDKSTPKKKSNKTGSLSERHKINRKEYGRRKNIWDYAVGGRQEIGRHPAPFPENLVKDHIISWSNEGDLVYDPFMGSGTTAKMSVLAGRNYIGSEISKEYCEIAEQRISLIYHV